MIYKNKKKSVIDFLNPIIFKKLENFSFMFAGMAILSIAISISLSHVFISLALTIYIFLFFIKSQPTFSLKKKISSIPKYFKLAFILYAFILLSIFVNSATSDHFWKNFLLGFSEFSSDIFLVFFALLIWKFTEKKEYFNKLKLLFYILSLLILITGLVAIFSKFPLNSILTGKDAIPQMYLGEIFGLSLYRTNGMMSLLLTYAGLLMLIFPILLSAFLYSLLSINNYKLGFFFLLLIIINLFLLFLNGTRSTSLAIVSSLPFLLYITFKNYTKLYKKYWKYILFLILSLFLFLLVLFLYSSKIKNPYLRSDNYRNLIWIQAGQIISENPIFGIGAGQYRKAVHKQWNEYRKEIDFSPKNLSYNIPTGHAHHDLLYLAAVAGLPVAILFLLFIFFIIKDILTTNDKWKLFLLLACFNFFVAGLAQCFFADDEVVLLFWILLAFISRETKEREIFFPEFSFTKYLSSFVNLFNIKIKSYLHKLPYLKYLRDFSFLRIFNTLSKETLLKTSFVFSNITILMMGLSISLTHLALVIALFSFIVYKWLNKSFFSLFSKENFRKLPTFFLVAFLFFLMTFLSNLYYFLAGLFQSDWISNSIYFWKDTGFIFILFATLLLHFAKDEKKKQILQKSFIVFSCILLLTGIFSIFSERQLSSLLLSSEAPFTDKNPPQVFLYSIGNINLYSPQGFMSNRLTYAGMLIFIIPFFFSQVLYSFLQRQLLHSVTFVFLFGASLLTLWLTGVRSSLLGLFCGFALLLWRLKDLWKVSSFSFKKKFSFFLPILIFFLLSVLTYLSLEKNLHTNILKPIFRNSNFGRIFMWSESGNVIQENPILGVGRQNYLKVSSDWRKNFVENNPDTWYFLNFIPKGHVHSDVLDIAYNYGILIAIIFIILLFLITKKSLEIPLTFRKEQATSIFLLTSGISFFIASFAQCYFKDDEVAIVFWTTISLAFSILSKTNKKVE